MTTEESKILSIIWNWGGEASLDTVAREAGISLDYAKVLCKSLGEEDFTDFRHSKLCKLKNKGKRAVVGKTKGIPQKIFIADGQNKFGLGKNKNGRFVLNY